jgi:hypothetical protein
MLPALLIGLVTGIVAVARGGSLESIAATRFRWLWLLYAGLGIQLIFDFIFFDDVTENQGLAILFLSYALIVGFIVSNRHLPGMWLVGIGLVLNVVVITANSAMPVSERALEIAGFESSAEYGIKHEALSDATILPWLGDVIPLPRTYQIVSLGDIVLGIGLARLIYVRSMADKEAPTPASD